MFPEDGWAKPQHVGKGYNNDDDDDVDSAYLNLKLNFYWHTADPYKGKNNSKGCWNIQ